MSAAPILVQRLQQIRVALNAIERVDPDRAAGQLSIETLAEAAELVIEFRRRLGAIESTLLWELGREKGRHVGYLADGRQYEIERSADRKEWQHEEWQHDVRRVLVTTVVDDVGESVFTADGTEVNLAMLLQETLATAQAIHGSQAPRTRSGLSQLGLTASDYSTSTPGGWRMKVVPRKRRAPNTVLKRPSWRGDQS